MKHPEPQHAAQTARRVLEEALANDRVTISTRLLRDLVDIAEKYTQERQAVKEPEAR